MTERLVILQVTEEEVSDFDERYNVVGIYNLPSVYCECPEVKRRNLRNWARGKRTGIPLCRTCRKPSRVWRSGIRARLEVALGKDVRSA